MEAHPPAGGPGMALRFCVSLQQSGEALTLSDAENCASVSACVSDDRSVLDAAAEPVIQTRCARDED